MSDAALRSNQDEMPEDPRAWREEFRLRMAEQGMIVRLPRTGALVDSARTADAVYG